MNLSDFDQSSVWTFLAQGWLLGDCNALKKVKSISLEFCFQNLSRGSINADPGIVALT